MKQFVVYDVTDRVVVGAHGEMGQAQDEAQNRNSNIDPVDKQGHKRYLTFEVDHVQGFFMKDDIAYIQSLRDRAIGFEMIAFYDDMLKKLRDARFRQMMNEQEFFWW